MAKIHLRRSKLVEGKAPLAACAAQSAGPNQCRPNSRSTYRFMASEIVSPAEFRATPHADRCAHCCDAGLLVLNRQRRDKGLPPVATFDEGGKSAA